MHGEVITADRVCGHFLCLAVNASATRQVSRSVHLTRLLGESVHLGGVVKKEPFLEILEHLHYSCFSLLSLFP